MSVWYDEYRFPLSEEMEKAFRACEADELLRKATRIQLDFHKMVVESGDHANDGIFRMALTRATEKLAIFLVDPWSQEDIEKVDLRDPLYQEYDAFRNLLDCLLAEVLSEKEIIDATVRILCDQLARRARS